VAQTTHGIGGLTYDASKRARPPELNVFVALLLIVAVFEILGRLIIGDSFNSAVFQTFKRNLSEVSPPGLGGSSAFRKPRFSAWIGYDF